MKKLPCICPNCGEETEIDIVNTSIDYPGVYLYLDFRCWSCKHQWEEFFRVKYDGYTDYTGVYDANGEKKIDMSNETTGN